jgi:hypothetical protein
MKARTIEPRRHQGNQERQENTMMRKFLKPKLFVFAFLGALAALVVKRGLSNGF